MVPTLSAQAIESTWKSLNATVGQSGTGNFARGAWNEGELYDPNGERKYLNRDERDRALAAMATLDAERSLFSLLLAWTGARVSEVLALTPHAFQVDACVVAIATLKRRKFTVREIPIPRGLMMKLDRHYGLRHAQRGEHSAQVRLWPWCRQSAWRTIKQVMALAGVSGRQACPRGLRHGFGVSALQNGVPLVVIQRLMGHAKLSTTSIYLAVCGPDVVSFMEQFWRAPKLSPPPSTRGTAHAVPQNG
jgi:site-specific recombinase XerD